MVSVRCIGLFVSSDSNSDRTFNKMNNEEEKKKTIRGLVRLVFDQKYEDIRAVLGLIILFLIGCLIFGGGIFEIIAN